MKKNVDPNFKASDELLKQLVNARREEVVAIQKAQAQKLKELDSRGQARISEIKKAMPKEMLTFYDTLEKGQSQANTLTQERSKKLVASFADSAISPEKETAVHPGLAGGHLVAPNSLGWFTPYYGTLHGSDGTVYWQGYYPGDIDLSDWADGAGWGWFGTGAGSFTVFMDWWFAYTPDADGYYEHSIYVPFHGFYIVEASSGWDSAEAIVDISLSTIGYQYNYQASSTVDLLHQDVGNSSENNRFDGWQTMSYEDLLGGGDVAYVRVTAAYYVYARASGSTAQLNFGDGNANYMGVPWIYVYQVD